jgi:hypothetical protein
MDNLSVYEFEQIHAIAAWKSERPSVLGSLFGGLFGPLKPWVARAVPRSMIEEAVAELETVGAIEAGMAEVAGRAKISDVRELRYSPMKECDSLASRVTMTAQRDQVVQNLLRRTTGSSGLQSSFPLPLVTAVRFICRVGHCYGYALDLAADRDFVLTILDSSTTQEQPSPGRARFEAGPTTARDIGGRIVPSNGVTSVRASNSVARSRQRLAPDRIVLDHAFLNRIEMVARRAFQERWLIDNGKAESIVPALPRRRSALDDVNRAMSEMAYLVGDAIGFGAVFPVVVLCELLARGEHAGARGVRDGARSAVSDADEFLAGLLGRDPPRTEPRRSRAIGSLSP